MFFLWMHIDEGDNIVWARNKRLCEIKDWDGIKG